MKITVGREDYVLPEQGPLELYRSRWPEREVVWDRDRQFFVVMQHNPVTGHYERYELLYQYEAPRLPNGDKVSDELLAKMIEERNPQLIRAFAPFDYEFVRRRIRQSYEFRHLGAKNLSKSIAAENAAVQRARIKDRAREFAAGVGEIRRWLPKLTGEERIPMVRGGFNTAATPNGSGQLVTV